MPRNRKEMFSGQINGWKALQLRVYFRLNGQVTHDSGGTLRLRGTASVAGQEILLAARHPLGRISLILLWLFT